MAAGAERKLCNHVRVNAKAFRKKETMEEIMMLKRKKVLAVLLAATTCIAMLAGCGGSSGGGQTQASGGGAEGGTEVSGPDTYSMIDNFDVTTLDYVYNNKSSNGDYTCNFIE
jgi:hypothetical protein